jgi:hypothetical protein
MPLLLSGLDKPEHLCHVEVALEVELIDALLELLLLLLGFGGHLDPMLHDSQIGIGIHGLALVHCYGVCATYLRVESLDQVFGLRPDPAFMKLLEHHNCRTAAVIEVLELSSELTSQTRDVS